MYECEVLSHFSFYHEAVVFFVCEELAEVFFVAVVVFRVVIAARRTVFDFAVAVFLALLRVVFGLAGTTC